MNNLPTALPQSGSLATSKTLDLSPLASQLLLKGRGDAAVEQILALPAVVAEVKAAYPAIMARVAPAGDDVVMSTIGRRFGTFPQPNRNEAEEAAFWEDYLDALQDIPAEAIELGMKAWIKLPTARFLPKPGELRALALEQAADLYTAASRAKRVMRAEPKAAPVDELTAEERRALVADALKGIGGKTPA